MNPSLWDNYAEGAVNEKIRYWVDLWESMIESLGDPSSGVRFDLMNPHLIIRHIIDEIVFNKFQNADNRAFFQRQLEFFAENDPATKKLFASDLSMIRREFGGSRLAYLVQLCRTVEQAYTKSGYLDTIYRDLRTVLENDTWGDKDEEAIRVMSQCIIVELLLIGYSLESVKKFPERIFDRSTGLSFHSDMALELNQEDFMTEGQPDDPAYRVAVQSAADSMTVSDRLDLFCKHFSPEPKSVFLLYQIEGLKGVDLDITIGNVNLYSPKTKQYIKTYAGEKPDERRNEELFGCDEEHCFANAAVKVQEFDTSASEREATAAIEKALDLFRAFVTSDVPFSVMANKFLKVSPDGEFWGSGSRSAGPMNAEYRHFRAFDLTRVAEHGFDENLLSAAGELLFVNDEDGGIGQRLSHSLHWYRKAEEAVTSEDRFLSYWIVLENIVSVEKSANNVLLPPKSKETKFSLIRELIPSLETCLYLQYSAATLFHYLRRLMTSLTNGHHHLTLPVELATKAQLLAGPGATINMVTFADNLQTIADVIDRKTIKDSVLLVHKLHTDIQFAREELSRRTNACKEDLLLFYRFRNRIVHNAHYDHTVLPHYIEKIRQYAGNTIRQVFSDLGTGRERCVEQSLMRSYVQLQRVEQKLKDGTLVDFFHLDT